MLLTPMGMVGAGSLGHTEKRDNCTEVCTGEFWAQEKYRLQSVSRKNTVLDSIQSPESADKSGHEFRDDSPKIDG